MANNLPVRFVPHDLIPQNKTSFVDVTGKKRTKNLAGYSDTRKVYWHYGVSIHPFIGKPWRVEIRSHVIFTEDGKTPLLSPQRMHKLRRGFCRNWWNDHFRSLLRAFLSFASNGQPKIELVAGQSAKITLLSAGMTGEAPVGLTDAFDLPEELTSVLDDTVDPDDEDDDDDGPDVVERNRDDIS
jgi:hypothetical protein